MAKKSKIAKNNKRRALVERYADRRAELVAITKDPNASFADKRAAYQEIAKMPRDASATRVRNRCEITGRPRAYLRQFGMSRIAVRELASKGELPGVRKASW